IKWLPTNNPQMETIRGFVANLESKQWQSQEQHNQALLTSLSTILKHCKNNVPFYKNILKDIDCDSITFEDFAKLPILSKNLIRENTEHLIATPFLQAGDAAQMHAFHTSGSTGTPMKIYRGTRNILFTRAL